MGAQTDPRPVQMTVMKASEVVPTTVSGTLTVDVPAEGPAVRAQRRLFLLTWRRDHSGRLAEPRRGWQSPFPPGEAGGEQPALVRRQLDRGDPPAHQLPPRLDQERVRLAHRRVSKPSVRSSAE